MGSGEGLGRGVGGGGASWEAPGLQQEGEPSAWALHKDWKATVWSGNGEENAQPQLRGGPYAFSLPWVPSSIPRTLSLSQPGPELEQRRNHPDWVGSAIRSPCPSEGWTH